MRKLFKNKEKKNLPCSVVPTLHQDCPWTHHLECGGCDGGDSVGAAMDEGKKRSVSPF